jgi:hypothetical protein
LPGDSGPPLAKSLALPEEGSKIKKDQSDDNACGRSVKGLDCKGPGSWTWWLVKGLVVIGPKGQLDEQGKMASIGIVTPKADFSLEGLQLASPSLIWSNLLDFSRDHIASGSSDF